MIIYKRTLIPFPFLDDMFIYGKFICMHPRDRDQKIPGSKFGLYLLI